MKKIDISKLKEFYLQHKILSVVIVIVLALLISWIRSVIVTGPKQEGGFSFFGKQKAKTEDVEPLIPVNTMKVSKTDFKDILPSIGVIKGAIEIDLKFQENGNIDSYKFKEGDQVKKGDILASLNQKEKQIKLDYAKVEFEKNKKLFELGGISKPKFEQSELELDSAQNEMNKTNIIAPSDGFMGTEIFDKGAYVTTSDKVGSFVDTSSLKCEVGIIEKDADKVKVGQKAFIMIENYPDKAFEGVVDSVSPMLEGRSKTQTVKIILPNTDNLIRPGMFARVNIMIFEKKDSIVIPASALKKSEDGFVVFAVEKEKAEKQSEAKVNSQPEKDKEIKQTQQPMQSAQGEEEGKPRFGVAKSKKVNIGRISQDLVLIDEGLSEGDEIIVETPESKEKIKDGTKVEILSVE